MKHSPFPVFLYVQVKFCINTISKKIDMLLLLKMWFYLFNILVIIFTLRVLIAKKTVYKRPF